MGCCFSLSRDTHYAPPTPTEEQSAAPPPHPTSRSPTSHHSYGHPQHNNLRPSGHTSASSSTEPYQHRPLTEHLNAPIRPHVWNSKRRRWTRSLLDQERTEFFETRVTGRPEVWAALSTALTFMRANDLVTAQSIIDAAGVTVPTGDLCQGVYDEQGVLYRLPRCIVSDPENMVVESAEVDERGETTDEDEEGGFETDDRKVALDEASGDELIGDGDGVVERERERRRDEKGKTSELDLIRVQARLSDRDGPDIVVSVKKTQNVGFIARKLQQEARVPKTQRIRIAYLGKMLKEHTPLIEQGYKPGNVLNALVVARRP
ncbi:hypothetical protein BJX63DRAFT_383840 [Aspergillus granulosus]|uniref:Ubiquitin-like domain-containing protein n=1 Tax=Aspergillus granulosus TaxID=176169 RepID=A0ABR4HS03_9EURO